MCPTLRVARRVGPEGYEMSRFSSVLVASLTLGAVASAQIRSITEFTGDAQEQFDCRVRVDHKACMAPDCPTMFGSQDNTLCTPDESGMNTIGGLDCIDARSFLRFAYSSDGWVLYTFDPPVARFGGYFGSPVPERGENNDAYVRFRDANGNHLGTRVARVGDGDCKWHWNGWESTGAPIAEIDVEGMLRGGTRIAMDDMEISYEAEVQCGLVKKLKLKCRNNELKATVKSRMKQGVELTIIDNGEETVVKTNKKGKAAVKLPNRTGRHRVIIQECPQFDKEVQCDG